MLLGLGLASFVYWSSFTSADGLIEDITFRESGDQSQLISYNIEGNDYEAEFLFDGFNDGDIAKILVERSDRGIYQLAPSTATVTFTALVTLLGTLMLSRAYRSMIS